MAGRPREFDVDAARDIAMQLFWSQGYEATSLGELLCAMDLSKSSFYQTFESKHTLFEQCLDRYRELLANDRRDRLRDASSPTAFIRDVLVEIANETRGPTARRGCLIMNTATEFAQRDPEIARCVKTAMHSMRDRYSQVIYAAQVAGEIDSKAAPEILADYLVTVVIGLKTQVKAGASHKQIKATAEVSFAALTSLS